MARNFNVRYNPRFYLDIQKLLISTLNKPKAMNWASVS